MDKVIAGVSLASELLPVSVGDVKEAKNAVEGIVSAASDAKKIDHAKDAKTTFKTEEAFIGPPAESHRFIVTEGGTVIHESQGKMKKSLESAGIQGKEIRENNVVKGTAYQLPNGVQVRAMEPTSATTRRASFDKGIKGTYTTPEGKNVSLPKSLKNNRDATKKYVGERTHIVQSN